MHFKLCIINIWSNSSWLEIYQASITIFQIYYCRQIFYINNLCILIKLAFQNNIFQICIFNFGNLYQNNIIFASFLRKSDFIITLSFWVTKQSISPRSINLKNRFFACLKWCKNSVATILNIVLSSWANGIFHVSKIS